MKITIDRTEGDIHVNVEHEPMSPERFSALCKLVGIAIGGWVLLGVVHEVGVYALAYGVGALVAVGFYKIMKGGLL